MYRTCHQFKKKKQTSNTQHHCCFTLLTIYIIGVKAGPCYFNVTFQALHKRKKFRKQVEHYSVRFVIFIQCYVKKFSLERHIDISPRRYRNNTFSLNGCAKGRVSLGGTMLKAAEN